MGPGYDVFKRKKRTKNGITVLRNWQVRIYVPKQYQEMLGSPDVVRSLHTEDEREAHRRAVRKVAEFHEEWESLQAPAPIDPEAIAVSVGYDRMLERLIERNASGGAEPDVQAEARRRSHRKLVSKYRGGDFDPWEGAAERAIEEHGLNIAKGSPEFSAFTKAIAEATLDAIGVELRAADGEFDAAPRSRIVSDVRAREAKRAKPGETIAELFEVYAKGLLESGKKRPAGVDQDRVVVLQFAEFVGVERAVSSIGYEEAKEYVDALAHIPLGYTKKKAYRGLTVREAIAKAQAEGAATLSLISQQRYISTLSPFFKHLKGEAGGRLVPTNPFDGLHKDVSRARRESSRPPFCADQIGQIVNSPLFTGFLGDGKEHLPGNQRAEDWRYWIPLICVFTGARIGEAAQLHVDDIFRLEGIWCIEFRSDTETNQAIKNNETRLVAVHDTLRRIGLIEFVERRQDEAQEPSEQLFPELEPGERGQFGDMPSSWWRRYLEKIGVKARGRRDGFGSHSFRHTLHDQLRAAGHLDDVFGPLIMGHSKGGVTSRYGGTRQGTPKLSYEIINSARFIPIAKGRVVEDGEPVDFSHLYRTR